MIDRYKITPEGLGEINIDKDDNGEWVLYEDVKNQPESAWEMFRRMGNVQAITL
jgi:hypothetical protein